MKECTACNHLLGQPTAAEPPSMLSGERVKILPNGVLVHFICRSCGTTWERFKHDGSYYGEPQFWHPA